MKELIVSNKQLPSIKEGVIKGLEIASGAKSSSTYYHKKDEQVAAVRQSVATLYAISKELPLLLASQKGVTGFFIQETLLNEFKNGERGGACNIVNPQAWYDEGIGHKLTESLLYTLERDSGMPYVLRMFESFKTHKINNQRARKMALRFILSHENLEFVSIKYRNKLRSAFRHIYGQKKFSTLTKAIKMAVDQGIYIGEGSQQLVHREFFRFAADKDRAAKLFLFIAGRGDASYYDDSFPVLKQFYAAAIDITGCNLLPVEVVEGIISNKNHPQHQAKWSTEEKRKATQKAIRETNQTTTANQAMRQTKKNEELGVTKKADASKVSDFIALYKTGYEHGFTPEIRDAIGKLAEKSKFRNFMYQNIGVLVDKSASMSGHKVESKNTPRAIASFTAEVLKKSASTCEIATTGKGGASDLATGFLDLIGHDRDAVFIISDGYENSYDGLLNEVVSTWRNETGSVMPIYHISPVTGSEVNAKVRSFGNQISTIAVNRPDGVVLQLTSKLLEQDIKAWLQIQVQSIKSLSAPKRKERLNVN